MTEETPGTQVSDSTETASIKMAAAQKMEEYLLCMRPLLFHLCNVDYTRLVFRREISLSENAQPRKERMLHSSRELAAISTSLPLNYASSIFLRVDEDRHDVLKALITGTPCSPLHGIPYSLRNSVLTTSRYTMLTSPKRP